MLAFRVRDRAARFKIEPVLEVSGPRWRVFWAGGRLPGAVPLELLTRWLLVRQDRAGSGSGCARCGCKGERQAAAAIVMRAVAK